MSQAIAGYKNSGFFVMRTPLLPLRTFSNLSTGVRPKERVDPATLSQQLQAERRHVRRNMAEQLERTEVREAIFLASPGLSRAVDAWLEHPASAAGRRAEGPLFRYLARMCTRCTPFGLFAGISVGELRKNTDLAVGPRADYVRRTRLDNGYLSMLLDHLSVLRAYRDVVVWYTNSSLYRIAGQIRYLESSTDPDILARHYELVAVDRTDYLDVVLEAAKEGATFAQLTARLVDHDKAVTSKEADSFAARLIESQMLVSNLQVPVTGEEPLSTLIRDLEGARDPQLLDQLRAIETTLVELDSRGVGNGREQYESVQERVGCLPVPRPEVSRLLQVNLAKPLTRHTLGTKLMAELRGALSSLHRIATPTSDPILERFQRQLIARYGGGPIPLVEALDEEIGIQFHEESLSTDPSPLLADLEFEPDSGEEAGRWGSKEQYLLRKLRAVWASGANELVLSDEDLSSLESDRPAPLPVSLWAKFRLSHSGRSDGDEEACEIFLEGAFGPPGTRDLGRFCRDDPALTEWVRKHTREEARVCPGAILAEIVHLPEGRMGNVTVRPVLREYEIPFLGRSGVQRSNQLGIEDLMISARAGQLVLHSTRLGREIIPRMSNAHNPNTSSLSLYRFLVRIQDQGGKHNVAWNWGALAGAPQLPRVRIGSVVVARQRWRISGTDLTRIAAARGSDRYASVAGLRREYGLPRHVALEDGDNELAADLENMVSVDSVLEVIKNRPYASFVELWPPPGRDGVSGPEGSFANEVIVPFVVKRAPEAGAGDPPSVAASQIRRGVDRHWVPGSEWLFLKYYAGESGVERLLRGPVHEELGHLLDDGSIDRWFFIRYGDPDWHLRLRLHGNPSRLRDTVLDRLGRAARNMLGHGVISRFSVDTYAPEIQRYGGEDGIALSEQLFWADSEAVLEVVAEILPASDEAWRWKLALLGVDRLLSDLGYDLDAKTRRVATFRDGLARQLDLGAIVERQLGRKYRQHKATVLALLTRESNGAPIERGEQVFDRRSEAIAPIAAELRVRAAEQRLTADWDDLSRSYSHMFCNRIFQGAALSQEMVVYDLLLRSYRTLAAIGPRE